MVIGILLLVVVSALLGIILIIRGVIGVHEWSDPQCVACGYSLRGFGERPTQCPECGVDLVDSSAIRFAARRRSPRQIVSGLVLLVGVPLVLAGISFAIASVSQMRIAMGNPVANLQTMTGQELVDHIAVGGGEPWVWNELEARLLASRLNPQLITSSIWKLNEYLIDSGSAGEPLSWANQYVGRVLTSEDVDEDAVAALVRTYYEPGPQIDMPGLVPLGVRLMPRLNNGSPWELADCTRLMSVVAVRIDGQPQSLDPRSNLHTSGRMGNSLRLPGNWTDLAVGDHVIEVDIERAVYAPGTPGAGAGRAGRIGPPATWPDGALLRETVTLSKSIKVVADPADAVELITDPELRNSVREGVLIDSVTLFDHFGKPSVHLGMELNPPVGVAVYTLITVELGDTSIDFGPLGKLRDGSGHVGTGMLPEAIELESEIPAGVTTATVILRPNVGDAWRMPRYQRIWGEEMVFEDVPVRRR